MNCRSNIVAVLGLAAIALLPESSHAALSCTSTQNISANTTLGSDYETTSTQPCFSPAAGVTFNLGGHQLICNNSGGCGTAIVRTGAGTTIKRTVSSHARTEQYRWISDLHRHERRDYCPRREHLL